MAVLLGIDTGGTYTDAVLFDEEKGVLASAKSLTTKHDLSEGLQKAARAVFDAKPEIDPAGIALTSISTTLATNAIVESHGNPVCLILIGQPAKSLDRAGLRQAVGSDPVVFVDGGHTTAGDEQAPLDEEAVIAAVRRHSDKVAAFAVAGYFAVRNPGHEQRVRDIIRAESGLPVTCAHELSSNLDAPRRALTAVLNARLIPLLQHLILAVQDFQTDMGIESPLMVVKGDGSLISAETALNRPVETILSGPAASVVGAQYLAGEEDVVVSDIGGTTTDIALLSGGQPVLTMEGATVAGHRTMVEAVAVHTVGLGGDSEIRLDDEKKLVAGPRRVVPLSLLAKDHDHVIPTLKTQLERAFRKTYDGKFALRLRRLEEGAAQLSNTEQFIWDKLADGPVALEVLLGRHAPEQPLRRLVDRGLVIISAFSPSDAAHVLGLHDGWNREAAELGATIWADTDARPGHACATDAEDFAAKVFEQVVIQTGEALTDALLDSELGRVMSPKQDLARQLIRQALADRKAKAKMLFSLKLDFNRPVVAIGAPARTYYPTVAERLNTRCVAPAFAEVSNAVGAVAGGVSQRVAILVSAPDDMRFRVHGPGEPQDFFDPEEAVSRATEVAETQARQQAVDAGAGDIRVSIDRQDKRATIEGRTVFIESTVTATAMGRPRLADS